MIKIRLWGEGAEIEKLVELICNDLTGIRVLSVSEQYKDRGASVYERCYMDVSLNGQSAKPAETTKAIVRSKL